jgi:predicted PurR-regulated permease PerM
MSRSQRIWVWLGVLAFLIFALYVINEIMLPFLIGIAIAYFLDPVADRLQRAGCSRLIATGIITTVFFGIAVALIFLIYPLVLEQMLTFFHKVPSLIEAVMKRIEPYTADLRRAFPSERMEGLEDAGKSFIGTVAEWFGRLVKGVWAGGLALFNAVSIVLITPVVAFYLLRDWDLIVAKIDSWLPREFAPTIRQLMAEVDTTIAGFVRGVGTVVLFLATVYGVGLTLVGLEFGLLVGLVAGFLSFIPYVGALFGVAVALVIALVQFGDWIHIAMVLAVFGFGQTVESFYLTPRLVGEKVGLHPVWVIFALMVGGLLMGFTGVLLAIPIAATIGVLVRFSLGQYLASPLYHGNRHRADIALPSGPDTPQ